LSKQGYLGIIAILFLSLISINGCTSQKTIGSESLFQKRDLYFSNKPLLDKNVELIFTVTPFDMPVEDWKNLLSQYDNQPEYKLEILLPEGFELVSGELEWQGYTNPGETKTLSVVVKSVKTGDWHIQAWAGPLSNPRYDVENRYVAVSEKDTIVSESPPKKGSEQPEFR
jgi:hypothetical protein